MVRIAREYGVSPLRQMREIFGLRYGPGKLAAHEYVSTGAFRPDFSTEQKREFVGRTGSYDLNVAASPMKLTVSRGFVRDKVLYTQLLRSLGLPATETQAVIHSARHLGDIPALRQPRDVADFLRTRATYPLFGKPVEGSGSVGSVLIMSVDQEAGLLHLGNGKRVDLGAFSQEVISEYPEGFLLQSAIEQHETLANVTGAAVGTLRVVTLRDADGIAPLYTIWKIPSPRAMSDNYWQDGSMIAQIDAEGKVTRCAQGAGPDYGQVEKHPASGVAFEGLQIPHWQRLHDIAVKAHGLFPEFGVIGWDIGMAQDGPIIIEANDNPFHALYQLAADRGIRNPDFLPRFEAAAAESQRILSSRIEVFNARQAAKKS
ncbi:hypothetical protein E4Z66_13360 [Aliishimia ponticola]|uniref:ATP-grasp domain-containing protein n=2 Tax=Aliishimia ponticola TaxID=2499833 RepID=A0A4S4NAC4_9RHOB|nr:hypothetical protein E4Z66_13360 [Aliishimia ponticola]